MGLYQVLQIRIGLGVVAMKEYFNFPKAPRLIIRWFSVIYRTLVGGSHPFAEMQSAYDIAPADRACYGLMISAD